MPSDSMNIGRANTFTRRTSALHGFTLIELMIAITLLTIVTGIVYASFSSVLTATETARVASEELRLRQFLTRNFTHNLSQTFADWRPGAMLREPPRSNDPLVRGLDGNVEADDDDMELARYWMEGLNDSGPYGAADTLSFATTAALIGGGAIPGVLKQVKYEIVRNSDENGDLLSLEDNVRSVTLEATETPIFEAMDEDDDEDVGERNEGEDLLGDIAYNPPGWSVPVRTLDIQYFDGEEWVEEWDSVEMGRLPWSIHFRINFARSKETQRAESASGIDDEEDPDYELVVTLPAGAGVTEPPLNRVHGIDSDQLSTDDLSNSQGISNNNQTGGGQSGGRSSGGRQTTVPPGRGR